MSNSNQEYDTYVTDTYMRQIHSAWREDDIHSLQGHHTSHERIRPTNSPTNSATNVEGGPCKKNCP